jgi:hypothetical protein
MPPVHLAGGKAVQPMVSLARTGEGLVAWYIPGYDPGSGDGPVSGAAVRPPGGGFGEPQQLSPGAAALVGVASNESGDATIGYYANSTLHAVFRPALGVFAAPVTIPTGFSDIAIDGRGDTTFVAWVEDRDDQTGQSIRQRLRAITMSRDGSLGPWREIVSANHVYGPRYWDLAPGAAGDAYGNVTVAWWAGEDYSSLRPYAATSTNGGEFSAPVALGAPTAKHDSNEKARVVANARGDVLVAWTASTEGGLASPSFATQVHTAVRPAGASSGPRKSWTSHPRTRAGWRSGTSTSTTRAMPRWRG